MTIKTFEEGDETPLVPYQDDGLGYVTPIVSIGTAAVTISGSTGLTNTELRATPVPVSGSLTVVGPNINTSSLIVGQVSCTNSGVAYQLPEDTLTNGAYIKALAANTGKIYVGRSTLVVGSGFELSAGELIIMQTANLNEIYVLSTVNGEKICWLEA